MSGYTETYLIWSAEHQSWWGPGGCGYYRQLSRAGRYTRQQALDICTRAIPGTAERYGKLPELPVRLADVEAMVMAYDAEFPFREVESWQ